MSRIAHNKLDLTGQRFGRLLALEDVGRDKKQSVLWMCTCDCGNKITVNADSLRSGNTKSCGCYHKIRTRELFCKPPEETGLQKVFCDYRKSARNKQLRFELSKEEFKILIKSNCYYCGDTPSNHLTQHGHPFKYQGINRLDNMQGYIPGNVVPCCIRCNKWKNNLTPAEFEAHIVKITEMLSRRKK